MIIGNKFMPYYNTISYKSTKIYKIIKENASITFLDLLSIANFDILELIYCIEFLFNIGYINYEDGKICLLK